MDEETLYYAAEYSNGGWAAVYFSDDKSKVETWQIMAMAQFLNSAGEVAEAMNPHLGAWVDAVERRKIEGAKVLARKVDDTFRTDERLRKYSFAFVSGRVGRPPKSDETRWTFTLGDIWDEQDKQTYRPLLDKTPIIDRHIKNAIRKEAK